jgi:hypothetical protein
MLPTHIFKSNAELLAYNFINLSHTDNNSELLYLPELNTPVFMQDFCSAIVRYSIDSIAINPEHNIFPVCKNFSKGLQLLDEDTFRQAIETFKAYLLLHFPQFIDSNDSNLDVISYNTPSYLKSYLIMNIVDQFSARTDIVKEILEEPYIIEEQEFKNMGEQLAYQAIILNYYNEKSFNKYYGTGTTIKEIDFGKKFALSCVDYVIYSLSINTKPLLVFPTLIVNLGIALSQLNYKEFTLAIEHLRTSIFLKMPKFLIPNSCIIDPDIQDALFTVLPHYINDEQQSILHNIMYGEKPAISLLKTANNLPMQ